MSAIGDYIHVRTSNYLKYGVSQDSNRNRPSIQNVYRQQKAANLTRINQLPDIDSNIINTLNTRVMQHLPEGRDGVEERAAQVLSEKKFADEFKNKLLNDINGNVSKIGLSKKTLKSLKFDNAKVNIEAAKAAKRRIDENISRINRFYSQNVPIAEDTAKTLVKNFNDYAKALGACLSEGTYLLNSTKIKNMDIVTAIQALSREISFAEASDATLQGQWGEKIVSLCGDVALNNALQAINGVIVGSQVSSFQLNNQIIPQVVGKKFYEDTGINLFQAHASQNKVDVQIVVNKQPLNVSVKAYSTKGNTINTHLQDVNLLTSLATTVPHFANHWLNLHCSQFSLPGVKIIDRALENHIKYEALVSGNLLKRGTSHADTFVAIDTTKGRVFSASTKDILQDNTIATKFFMRPNIHNLYISGNVWASSWEARISKILQSVHQVKISTILNIKLK